MNQWLRDHAEVMDCATHSARMQNECPKRIIDFASISLHPDQVNTGVNALLHLSSPYDANTSKMTSDSDVAVIGLSYRAPKIGGKGLGDFLCQGRSAWSKIPTNRFEQSAYWKAGEDKTGVFRAEGAHFVPGDIYAFDAPFFNMRPEEAKNSDPQHRMILECALEAAEDAGLSLLDLAGKNIGVFMGAGQHEFSQRSGDDEHSHKTWTATGCAACMVANRVSYFFGITGPSVALDAACASSAYAAHQAIKAVKDGECDAAFVGAAVINLEPGSFLALEKTG